MSYVGYGQSPYVQEPKIRFDAISEAWGLVREKLAVWVTAMLITGVVLAVVYAILGSILYTAGMVTIPSVTNPQFLTLPGRIIFSVVGLLAGAFFYAGLMRMAIKQVRGQDIQTGDLFSAGDVVGGAIATQLVYGILTQIGMVLCLIPGMIVAGRGILSMPLTVDKNISGLAAFGRSWDALKNETLNAVLFSLVAGLVSGLGILACGIGGLVTAPIYYVAVALVYRDFFDTETGVRGATLAVPLPPASAYGAGAYNAPPTPARPGEPLPYGQTPGNTGRAGDTGTKPPDTPGQMAGLDM